MHLAIFSERSPLPRTVVHNVADGVLGAEIESRRESKKGVFREIEADLVMSIETAIALREWLNERITESELISSMISEKK